MAEVKKTLIEEREEFYNEMNSFDAFVETEEKKGEEKLI